MTLWYYFVHWSKYTINCSQELGSFAWTYNPSKWEDDIWGWLEVRRSSMLHYTVNQHPHWAFRQYGHSEGTWGWLDIERCQLCMQCKVTSASSSGSLGFIMNFHCVWSVVGWLIVYQNSDYLYPSEYSQTICQLQIVMILPSGQEHQHDKTQYIPGKQVMVRLWLWKIINCSQDNLPCFTVHLLNPFQ